jgi:hypothetical protein
MDDMHYEQNQAGHQNLRLGHMPVTVSSQSRVRAGSIRAFNLAILSRAGG